MSDKKKKLIQRPKKGNLQFATTAPWMQKDKPIISPETITKYRLESADRHAHRAVQERDLARRNTLNGITIDNSKASSKGVVQDANKVAVDKALSWYGLSNGLGLTTNVSDKGRNTPLFGRQMGQLPQQAALLGLGHGILSNFVPGGAFWTRGILYLNPSRYLGQGSYSTALGGENVSLLGAIADNGLASYGASEAILQFKNNPNFGNGTAMVLAGLPILGGGVVTSKPTLTTNQFEHSFGLGRYKSFEDLLKYNISKENAQKLFKLATDVKKKFGYFNSKNLDEKLRKIYDALLDNAENNLFGKKGANVKIKSASLDPDEAKLIEILNKYLPGINASSDRVRDEYGLGIDWNWENSFFNGMPLEFKIKPLYDARVNGVSDNRPFILRFYENVSNITKKGGLMDTLLKEKLLRTNGKKWEGWDEVSKSYQEVDPTLYIVSRLKNFKASGNRLTINKEKIPYHGTLGTSSGQSKWSELSKKYATGAVTKDDNAIFTVIADDMPGVGSMMSKYKGNGGVSIPFFRKLAKFEHPDYPVMDARDPEIVKRVGLRQGSNDYGLWGLLKDYFRGHNGGYASEVKSVTDPLSSGLRVNEYNFGSGTEDVKSIWNTLDFEPTQIIKNPDGTIKEILRTSPFAYNSNNNNIDRNNYA